MTRPTPKKPALLIMMDATSILVTIDSQIAGLQQARVALERIGGVPKQRGRPKGSKNSVSTTATTKNSPKACCVLAGKGEAAVLACCDGARHQVGGTSAVTTCAPLPETDRRAVDGLLTAIDRSLQRDADLLCRRRGLCAGHAAADGETQCDEGHRHTGQNELRSVTCGMRTHSESPEEATKSLVFYC